MVFESRIYHFSWSQLLNFILAGSKCKNFVKSSVLIICIAMATIMNNIDAIIPTWEQEAILVLFVKAGRQLFAPYVVYVAGMSLRRVDLSKFVKDKKMVFAISSFILLLVLKNYGTVDLSMGKITHPLFFAVVTLLGWILIMSISYMVDKNNNLRRLFEYLGQHTLCIVILHLLSFKLVSLYFLQYTGSNMILLASFPVLDNMDALLWLFYSTVGLGLPLLLDFCYRKYKRL